MVRYYVCTTYTNDGKHFEWLTGERPFQPADGPYVGPGCSRFIYETWRPATDDDIIFFQNEQQRFRDLCEGIVVTDYREGKV